MYFSNLSIIISNQETLLSSFSNRKEIDSDIVKDLFFNNREERVNFTVIAERQVQILLQSLLDESHKDFPVFPESTIEVYHFYGILSDAEYKSLINHYVKD